MTESRTCHECFNEHKRIHLRTKQDRLLKKRRVEENLQNRLLKNLQAGENFMDTLNNKISDALHKIYDMQKEAADWNRLLDNFSVLNYCYVDSMGTLHNDTMHDPNQSFRCYEHTLPRRKIPEKKSAKKFFQ
jgi:hypothetical protein